MSSDNLFVIPLPKPSAAIRLFCFPFAGGSSATYLPWAGHLPAHVELVVCQLPGRGLRLMEPAYDSMPRLVSDLCAAMTHYQDKPFIFFGHSMGAKVAYEVAVTLRQFKKTLPTKLIVSAASAPFLPRKQAPISHLPDSLFIQAIGALEGTPAQVLANPELMALFLPSLRADFKMVEEYQSGDHAKLDCSLTLLGGVDDKNVSTLELNAWRQLFTQFDETHLFPGGHFYFNKTPHQFLQRLKSIIATPTAYSASA